MKTVEECKKIAAEILGVDEKNLIQHIDGDIYGFYSEKDQTRDIAIDLVPARRSRSPVSDFCGSAARTSPRSVLRGFFMHRYGCMALYAPCIIPLEMANASKYVIDCHIKNISEAFAIRERGGILSPDITAFIDEVVK